jgi:hypothetical protein
MERILTLFLSKASMRWMSGNWPNLARPARRSWRNLARNLAALQLTPLLAKPLDKSNQLARRNVSRCLNQGNEPFFIARFNQFIQGCPGAVFLFNLLFIQVLGLFIDRGLPLVMPIVLSGGWSGRCSSYGRCRRRRAFLDRRGRRFQHPRVRCRWSGARSGGARPVARMAW